MSACLSGHRQSLPFHCFSRISDRCWVFFNILIVSLKRSISSCVSCICACSCSFSVAGASAFPSFKVSGCMFLWRILGILSGIDAGQFFSRGFRGHPHSQSMYIRLSGLDSLKHGRFPSQIYIDHRPAMQYESYSVNRY